MDAISVISTIVGLVFTIFVIIVSVKIWKIGDRMAMLVPVEEQPIDKLMVASNTILKYTIYGIVCFAALNIPQNAEVKVVLTAGNVLTMVIFGLAMVGLHFGKVISKEVSSIHGTAIVIWSYMVIEIMNALFSEMIVS